MSAVGREGDGSADEGSLSRSPPPPPPPYTIGTTSFDHIPNPRCHFPPPPLSLKPKGYLERNNPPPLAVNGHINLIERRLFNSSERRRSQQSILSKRLNPPVKWSYRKLVLWWALLFLSAGWIIFYVNAVTIDSSAVLSPPLILFLRLSVVIFLLLLVLFWRHNQSTYKRQYSQWERSFLCQRCGTLAEGVTLRDPFQ
jgi:hypothetical protein